MNRRRYSFLILALASFVPMGCGQTAFSPHFQDNNIVDLQKALDGVRGKKSGPINAMGKPLIFIVTRAPSQVVAYDLESAATLWTAPVEITSKITIGRTRIYFRTGARSLEARDIRSGQKVWSTELQGGDQLIGLTADGEDLYYVTENTKRTADGTAAYLVAVNGATGRERWTRASTGRLGAPVASDGRVFLPLRFQAVSIIKGDTGDEVARIRSKEETILWVRDSRSGILFGGQKGIYRLDEKAVAGSQQGSTFIAAPLPKGVRPVYWWDGYNAALSSYTAYDRNRLLWETNPAGTGFLNNTLVVHNYRYFFSFDTSRQSEKGSGLKWAYNFPRTDVVGSNYTGDTLVLVSVGGDVVVLDPKVGVPVSQKQLKLNTVGATFDIEGLVTSGRASGKPDLRQALTEAIWDPDRRFGSVKLFCVEQLAQLSGGRVAEDLVKIISQEGIDPAVYKRTGEMIVSRHDKASIRLYLDTLNSHYSFVEGTTAKAVDIMARALGDLTAPEAVRPLLLHLADHETPLTAVEEIIKALVAIGDSSVMEPFRDFILSYRCDPDLIKAPRVLSLIADGLLKMGGENERQLLSFIENDSNTLASLRIYLREALKQVKPGAVKKLKVKGQPKKER